MKTSSVCNVLPASWMRRLALCMMLPGLAAGGRPASADASAYPKRKPGLWELTRSSPNPKFPPQVQQICLDEATDQMLFRLGAGAGRALCEKLDVRAKDGTVVVDSVCSMGATKATSHSVISFNGDTAYHEEISAQYDPPLLGKTHEAHSTQDGKWTGACTADMKPGDIVVKPSSMMPFPIRMNIRNLLQDAGGPQPASK